MPPFCILGVRMPRVALGARWQLAKRAVAGLFSDRSATQAFGLLSGIYPGATGASPMRGTRELLEGYSQMPWLRAVTQKIARSVAATDWVLYAPTSKRRSRVVQRAVGTQRAELVKGMLNTGDLEALDSHILLDALFSANDFLVGPALFSTTQTHIDLVGEAFWIKDRNALGAPIGFWPIPPHWVTSTPSPKRRAYSVSFAGWQGDIPEAEIIWFLDPDPANPYGRGSGVARALGDELETDEYAARHCHDVQTECLTRRGWVPGLDIEEDDEIATWNHTIGRMEYQRPSHITRARYTGEMHHWHGQRVDACVTPTHRLWIERRGAINSRTGKPLLPLAQPWHFEDSQTAVAKPGRPFYWRDTGLYDGAIDTVRIPGVNRVTKRKPNSRGGGRPPKFGVDQPLEYQAVSFASFLGYYVSEGSRNRRAICLAQSEGKYVDDIRTALRIFPPEWVKETYIAVREKAHWSPAYKWTVSHHGLCEWLGSHVGDGAANKRLPLEVYEWPLTAQRELLRTLINGDGSRSEKASQRYWTHSRGLADDVQRLCVQVGWSAYIGGPSKTGEYGVNIRTDSVARLLNGKGGGRGKDGRSWATAEQYDGMVWCVTVPNELFFSRRNGRVMLGGNTRMTFLNRARPDLIVWPEETKTSPGEITQDNADRLGERWRSEHQGFWRAALPFFATRKIGVHEIQQDFQSLQLIDLRKHERDIIIQVYGLPPEELGVIESSNRACHSADTECLTKAGWKTHDALTTADEIATWNHAGQRVEYHKPTRVVRYQHDGEMHHWRTRSVDVLVTPDHRMWTQTQFRDEFHIRRSYELAGKKLQQRWRATGGGYDPRGVDYVDIPAGNYLTHKRKAQPLRVPVCDFAEYLGYWLAEGSAEAGGGEGHGYEISICQNAGEKADVMKAAAQRLGVEVGNRTDARAFRAVPLKTFHFRHKGLAEWLRDHAGLGAKNKRIPPCAFEWPAAAQKRLLDAMLLGDGTAKPARSRSDAEYSDQYYATSSKRLADDVQKLCIQLGLRSSVRLVEQPTGHDPVFAVGISSKQHVFVSTSRTGKSVGLSSPLTIESYSGIAWCVEVENSLFFTRRNGKVALHGNTIDASDFLFKKNVILPRLELLRAYMQERLIPEYDDRLLIDFVSPVLADQEFKLKVGLAAPWAFKVDEWRHLGGRPPLDGARGDVHLVPSGWSARSDVSKDPPPPVARVPFGGDRVEPKPFQDKAARALDLADSGSLAEDALVLMAAGDTESLAVVEREMDDFPDDLPELSRRIGVAEDTTRRWIEVLLAELPAETSELALEQALSAGGDIESIAAVVPIAAWSEKWTSPAQATLRDAFLVGAFYGAEVADVTLTKAGQFELNQVNAEALKWAEAHAGELITQVSEATMLAIRAVITDALKQGWSAKKTARIIRSAIGLTTQQSQAVLSFAQSLGAADALISDARLYSRVQRYAEAQRRVRALTIARTELLTASNRGQQLLWELAISRGQLRKDRMRRKWLVAFDERLCAVCEKLAGETVPLDKAFSDGTFIPPRHVNCRCSIGLVQTKDVVAPRVDQSVRITGLRETIDRLGEDARLQLGLGKWL